jgi:type VI protein secretion system component Hcp
MKPSRSACSRLVVAGVASALVLGAGALPASAAPSVSDLSVTKVSDKASPTLMQACSTGRHIPEVQLP